MATIRARQWALTVFENAPCWNSFATTLKKEFSDVDIRAYILHDKDLLDDGTPKNKHYHIVISCKNARAFTSMQRLFNGAHIEIIANITASIQYLVHKNNPEKHRYNLEEITTNAPDYIKETIENVNFDVFNPDMIIEYYHQGTKTLIDFYLRFGSQINQYRGLIIDLCKELRIKELRLYDNDSN